MRDARNLEGMSLEVGGKVGKIHSFWITEEREIFVKVVHENVYVNYQLSDKMKNEIKFPEEKMTLEKLLQKSKKKKTAKSKESEISQTSDGKISC
jgi:hypothetical protein